MELIGLIWAMVVVFGVFFIPVYFAQKSISKQKNEHGRVTGPGDCW